MLRPLRHGHPGAGILLLALFGCGLHAADERKLALQTAAQTSFERAAPANSPDLAKATACVDSQSMLLAVATPQETPEIVFRKAYCSLARAAMTGDRAAFARAGEGFDDAIADAQGAATKSKTARDVPSSWRILASVSRLLGGAAGNDQEKLLAQEVDTGDCQGDASTPEFCRSIHQLGNAWLGSIAFRKGDLTEAQRRTAN
jgi:hypothetical protein